jgi:hypothetical protein
MTATVDPKEERLSKFSITVQGGMLDALGINMYTTIGKCLVEFVANAYDSNASYSKISIPFEAIAKARATVRAAAKAAVKAGEREKFRVLLDPLPDDVEIVISDDGHGMKPVEVQEKFLPLNRRRREQPDGKIDEKTEGGKRYAMGRKGLGKMAGFGAALLIKVRTKRAGDPYATEFVLKYDDLSKAKKLEEHEIEPKYVDAEAAEHGTEIRLSRLRCDALSAKKESIEETLLDNFFGVESDDFEISLNDETLKPKPVHYEFFYPEGANETTFQEGVVTLEDDETIPIRFVVKFRGRSEDEHGQDALQRGSLPAKRRGARVYCNKRLAAGPSLLDLPTGMHNFHSQSYMECIVEADDLDRHDVDLINTNRSDLRRDNSVVDTFVDGVTSIMKDALVAHAKFRESTTEDQIKKNELARELYAVAEHLPAQQRKASKSIIRTLASDFGVNSDQFKETAPLVLQSVNAGRVLIRLGELATDPVSYTIVAEQLEELRDIEHRDALKLYTGRKKGILALKMLLDRGDENWKKGPHFEDELHDLLKEFPWLIRPEFSSYLTSNITMARVAQALTKELKIDDKAPQDPDKRPDLVFLLQDTTDTHQIIVVELKSPSIPLNQSHVAQLRGYIEQTRILVASHTKNNVIVRGFLIGQLAHGDKASIDEKVVIREYQERRDSDYVILTPDEMFESALRAHLDEIEHLEAEEQKQEAAGSAVQPQPAA